MIFRTFLPALGLCLLAPAQADPIFGGIDLATFDFDVASYDVGSNASGLGGDATASGTSNGIGWSISPTSLWAVRTTTGGNFSFSALPTTTDNLHPSGAFTITFVQKVDKLLVALSNNNCCDTVNFGIVPTLMQGVSASGTQLVLGSAAGGLALFENLKTLTIVNVDNNGISDGYDLAFHAVAVPEPATWALWLAGIGGVLGLRRGPRRLG